MASSDPEADPAWQLGQLLTGAEAADLAVRIERGDTLTAALRAITPSRRVEIRRLLNESGLSAAERVATVTVLRAIHGARSITTATEAVWTLPGHLARGGRLHGSVARLVEGARTSITCSTYNFQRSSGLWQALAFAARRPEITLTVYVDARAADGRGAPSADELARHLQPGRVFRTATFDGQYVRNHAKYLVIDHRFALVTSANYSWSAEHGNVEFGVLLDNPNLAESIELEARRAEDTIYLRVSVDS